MTQRTHWRIVSRIARFRSSSFSIVRCEVAVPLLVGALQPQSGCRLRGLLARSTYLMMPAATESRLMWFSVRLHPSILKNVGCLVPLERFFVSWRVVVVLSAQRMPAQQVSQL